MITFKDYETIFKEMVQELYKYDFVTGISEEELN